MIVCDTGPLVAAALSDDEYHRDCVDLFTALHLAGRRVLVPGTVLAEVGYLLEREAGPSAEAAFLRSLAAGDLDLVELIPSDIGRMAELVDQYADFPLGTTDASVIAVSERLGLTEVATLDRRHFAAIRPRHTRNLNLLPE